MFLFSRLFAIILTISCLLTFFVGCGADEEPEVASEDGKQELAPGETVEGASEVVEEEPPPVILYPGAPVITIEKTAFNGWEGKDDPALHYRLKAEEPLPYDVEVRLSIQRTYTVDGWIYGDVDDSEELEVDEVIEMRKDRLTYEDSIKDGSDTRIQTRTLQILPWKGPGDDPYNVGKPSRLKITRKPAEGKVVPQIVSVEPPSDSEIAVDGTVTITFDREPSDAKISSTSSLRSRWWPDQEFKSPQFKINGNVLTLTQFTLGYTTDLEIRWGGGRTRKTLSYSVPMVVPQIVSIEPPSDSEIAVDDTVTITFDRKPSDAKISSASSLLLVNGWLAGRQFKSPQSKINGNVLTLTQFTPGYTMDLTIGWGGGRARKTLSYSVPMEVSIDRVLLSADSDGTISLWDVDTGRHEAFFNGHGRDSVTSVAFSPDRRTIVSGSSRAVILWNAPVHLWDADTGALKNTLNGHTASVHSVAFSPDGRTIASGSRDKTVRLWDADTGALKNTLNGHTGTVSSMAFSPDGRTLVSSDNHNIYLWDADTGAQENTLGEHGRWCRSVAFSPDGRTIAGGNGSRLRLWDADTGALKNTLNGHTETVLSVAFSPDGRTIASASMDDTVRLWDADTGAHRRRLGWHRNWADNVAFSPDGRTLASTDSDEIYLWDADTGALKHDLFGSSLGSFTSVAFSPD